MPLVEKKSPARRKSPARILVAPSASRQPSDADLVQRCLRGDENAWPALIDRYKALIYSIPLKYRFSPDDAADIFQSVCVELLSELPNLRRAEALPKWIIQVAAHKCFHHKQQMQRYILTEDARMPTANIGEDNFAQIVLKEAEEEQALRTALNALPERCRKLVNMLFFEEPVRPYTEIAKDLGLATGSIGFIRQRCLARMRKSLREAGLG